MANMHIPIEITLKNLTFQYFSEIKNGQQKTIGNQECDEFLKEIHRLLNPIDLDRDGLKGKEINAEFVDISEILINLEDKPDLQKILDSLDILEVDITNIRYSTKNLNMIVEKRPCVNNIFIIRPNLIMIQGAKDSSEYIIDQIEKLRPKFHINHRQQLYHKRYLLWILTRLVDDTTDLEQILPFRFNSCSMLELIHSKDAISKPKLILKDYTRIHETLMGSLAFLSQYLPERIRVSIITPESEEIEFDISKDGWVNVLMDQGILKKEKTPSDLKRILIGIKLIMKLMDVYKIWIQDYPDGMERNTTQDIISDITKQELAIKIAKPIIKLFNKFLRNRFEVNDKGELIFRKVC